MEIGDRYGAWYGGGPTATLGEEMLLDVPERLDEAALQAHWFAGNFGRSFTSTTGAAVSIVQFGLWNHEAGPDFAEAAISLNGAPPIRGSIELDTDARDWERHGHATNADYENVVLHLFTQRGPSDFFTRTALHRNVPQVHLNPETLSRRIPFPLPGAKPGRCIAALRRLPMARVREILLGAAQFRLKRKAGALATLCELHGPDEALYQALAAALGYKNNKLPFTLLAQRLPLRLASHARSDAPALFFGLAGFLSDPGELDSSTRLYLRGLWEQWWPQRARFERLILPAELWKMGGQRPANHPQRRLAALVQIVRHWPGVRALRQGCDPAGVRAFFHKLHDPYWTHHFTLGSRSSAQRMALVGASRVTEMLMNVFLPMAFPADPQKCWAVYECLPSTLSSRRVAIALTRLFGESSELHPALLKTAALQQGLLQIYEDFCMQDATDCAHCPFPEQVARW